jgi:hypothetical protein
MKVLLQKDDGKWLDLAGVAKVLNQTCASVAFTLAADRPCDKFTRTLMNLDDECERLLRLTASVESDADLAVYLTPRRLADSHFLHERGDVAIVSLHEWIQLTPLPKENGAAYFIAHIIADTIAQPRRHSSPHGCLYDNLWVKTEIDRCLKQAHLCQVCRTHFEGKQKHPDRAALMTDVVALLDLVANTSRWGRNITAALADENVSRLNWETFEGYVADHYRSLGGEVKQNVSLGGFQIDIVVSENTRSGELIRTAVECKFYQEKVGNRIVNDFCRVLSTLRDADLVDRGVLVAYSGFTPDAHAVAQAGRLKLLTYADILHRSHAADVPPAEKQEPVRSVSNNMPNSETQDSVLEGISVSHPLDVFVIMPFTPAMDDVYYLAIHPSVEELGLSCARVDEIDFTGSILDELYRQLRTARLVIAEVTQHNPNVYYELGVAHGMQRPVVLLTSSVASAPFDLKMINHVTYANLRELKTRLVARLGALLVAPGK